MNLGLFLLLLIGTTIGIVWTLAIAKNPGSEKYSSESSFNLLSLHYLIIVPILLVVLTIILFFLM
ncbi:hypothetical protein DH09_11155 [Bacillaceae bacterium JMAK1]|nr:hypothetical protein DH09_11155 [Bacillaceae bacterium JMAK1]